MQVMKVSDTLAQRSLDGPPCPISATATLGTSGQTIQFVHLQEINMLAEGSSPFTKAKRAKISGQCSCRLDTLGNFSHKAWKHGSSHFFLFLKSSFPHPSERSLAHNGRRLKISTTTRKLSHASLPQAQLEKKKKQENVFYSSGYYTCH